LFSQMRLKHLYLILLCYLFFLAYLPNGFAFSDSIKWYSYEKGLALGEKEEKKIFLHFYANWCGYCLKMARVTFTDPLVISYLNENFIPIRVDVEREKQTASIYQVQGLPTTWFIAENGENISKLPGYLPPDMLINILKYIHTESYNKMSFKTFVDNR